MMRSEVLLQGASGREWSTRLVQSLSLLGYARAGRDSAHSTQMPPSAHPLLPAGIVRPLYSWATDCAEG